MIRCCFSGEFSVYDADLDKKIAAELEKMVQLDDEIEFWFLSPKRLYCCLENSAASL